MIPLVILAILPSIVRTVLSPTAFLMVDIPTLSCSVPGHSPFAIRYLQHYRAPFALVLSLTAIVHANAALFAVVAEDMPIAVVEVAAVVAMVAEAAGVPRAVVVPVVAVAVVVVDAICDDHRNGNP